MISPPGQGVPQGQEPGREARASQLREAQAHRRAPGGREGGEGGEGGHRRAAVGALTYPGRRRRQRKPHLPKWAAVA